MNSYRYTYAETTRTSNGSKSRRLYVWQMPEESGAPRVYEGQEAFAYFYRLQTEDEQKTLATLFVNNG